MAGDLAAETPADIEPLIEGIRERCGPSLRAIVLYGSTRRGGNFRDGLVDLMAVVGDYRSVHGFGLTALLNHVLPPNVYYLEAGPASERIRCKYIVISEPGFRRRTGSGLDGYFWARFTQPCRLVWTADTDVADRLAGYRAAAAAHFASQGLSLGNGTLTSGDFWTRAVAASYGCELRPEPPGAAAAMIARDTNFWDGLSKELLPSLDGVVVDGSRFRIALTRRRRFSGKLRWRRRRVWSKMLNILRLLKAAGTFANGIDYLSWKIERHSGTRVEITDAMRRHPRLAAWKLLFRMWRSGALG